MYASSHSTSFDNITVGFFFDTVTQLGCHLLHITAIQRQLCAICSFDKFSPMKYRYSTHTFSG